ncbi:MAG TPA: hypothetical protein VHB79_04340 [Polyangiaceae bacterium]|nr:hypothetical protein [Polyangiaceae bacterium]
MAIDLALVSESDPEQRDALLKVLNALGYRVLPVPNPSQLEQQLLGSHASSSASLLLVLDVMLAKSCAHAIQQCARQRQQVRLPLAAVVLVYERGSLTSIARPTLAGCEILEIAEKPLQLEEFRAVAMQSRLASRRFDLQGFR